MVEVLVVVVVVASSARMRCEFLLVRGLVQRTGWHGMWQTLVELAHVAVGVAGVALICWADTCTDVCAAQELFQFAA